MFIEPPKRLVDKNGNVTLGVFTRPVDMINVEDYVYIDEMDRVVTGRKKRWKVHRFNYFGILGERWTIGLAVVDLSYLGNAFLYLYDRQEGRIHEFNYLSPLSAGMEFSNFTAQGKIAFKKGRVSFKITQDFDKRVVEVRIPGLKLDFEVPEDPSRFQHLSMATRNSYSGWTYTQKAAGLAITKGNLKFQDQTYDLTGTPAIFDWTNGYLRADTYWVWAAGAGQAGEIPLGFNFSNGVNETVYTENAIWLNGALNLMGGVMIEYDRFKPEGPWKVYTPDRNLELTFTPKGARKDRLNFKLIQSNFTQFFGDYTGHILLNGKRLPIQASGFAEKHFARW